jgi:membrane-associated phospholipid phosphatase
VLTSWPLASIVFFAYVVVAAEWRAPSPRARWLARLGSAIGTATAVAAFRLPIDGLARGLVLPVALLLIAYWTTGVLFVRPMPRAERLLARLDDRLRIDRIAGALPRPIAELLEFSYSSVYPLILVALLLSARAGVTADRFWSVMLVTDFVCFGMLPWIQTRPPRSVTGDPGWRSSWRSLNQRLLEASSVQANTFPSGHAAEALAAALLVAGFSPWLTAVAFMAAIAVSAGAVLGRYHYAADAIAGWATALCVYLLPSTF